MDGRGRDLKVHFQKRIVTVQSRAQERTRVALPTLGQPQGVPLLEDGLKAWITIQCEEDLYRLETEALQTAFGSELERDIVVEERAKNVPIFSARRICQEYVRRYSETQAAKGAHGVAIAG
jgi:hypothetical protein